MRGWFRDVRGLVLAIAAPLVAAALASLPLQRRARVGLALVTGAAVLAAVLLGTPADLVLAPGAVQTVASLETVGDTALLLYFVWVAVDRRSWLTGLTAAANAALFAWITGQGMAHPTLVLHADPLARFFLIVIALVAPAIWAWAPYYHEHYRKVTPALREQPYYFWLFAIVGVMAALVTANDLMDLYLLWELTTLASFLLIDSPRSGEARAASVQALWMNGVGGAAFLAGVLVAGSLSLAQVGGLAAVLLAVAAAIKAAQLPFSRWLVGAMAAPGPVSALLHSSTMVKAGVYLALRLAPALHQGPGGPALAWLGALTFLGAAWLASGSRRTKEVLAYSTISNLGLMLAMAGIGTTAAVTAALALVLFHAVGKALLFLVAGGVEADLGSRDLEAAGGLMEVRPELGVLGIWGVVSLYMPPLGLLFAKWLAIEASAASLAVYALLAVGSGLTGFFWTKVLGRFACAAAAPEPEGAARLPRAAYYPLRYLAALVAAGSVALLPITTLLLDPVTGAKAPAMGVWYAALLTAAALGALTYVLLARRRSPRALPYASGIEAEETPGALGRFRSSADQPAVAALAGFYPSAAWEAASERVFLLAGALSLVGMVVIAL